jgi:predicted MPP superfamily phosphohydrolase
MKLLYSVLILSISQIAFAQWSEDAEFNFKDYAELVKKDAEDFRILQITDPHLAYYILDEFNAVNKTLNLMEKAIKKTKPNLIALTGDNVTGPSNMHYGKKLIKFLDGFDIPYLLVMGNHDGEAFMNKEDIPRQEKLAAFFETGKYSLFKRGPHEVYGTGNYGVHLVNEQGELLWGLVMFDTNRDYLRANQVAWYEWYIRGLNKAVKGSEKPAVPVKTLAFFHIPLSETRDLYNSLLEKDPATAKDAFREKPSASKNSGMFAKMKELDSTKYLFFGHDHRNRCCLEYEGINFVYGLKSGHGGYHDEDRVGTTLITIKADESVTVEFIKE